MLKSLSALIEELADRGVLQRRSNWRRWLPWIVGLMLFGLLLWYKTATD
jgi:hypothetical protein